MRSSWLWLIIVAFLAIAGIVFLLSIPRDMAQALTTENTGFFEYGAVIGYFFCTFLILIGLRIAMPMYALLAIIPAVLGLREMDMDKRYFTEGLFKSSQYFKGEVAWPELIISILILVFIITCIVMTLKRGLRPLITAIWGGKAWAFAIGAAILAAVIAKSLDGIGRKLRDFGIEISENFGETAELIEEGLELSIPAFLIVAVLAYRQIRMNAENAP